MKYLYKIKPFISGKGLDVSPERTLPDEAAMHFFQEPNNLYLLKQHFPAESFDFVFAKDIINKTKYYKILVREWFDMLKVGGFLIMSFTPSRGVRNFNLEELKIITKLMLKDNAAIELMEKNREGVLYVVKKVRALRERLGNINEWTFGIVTNGKRRDWLEAQFQSIRKQQIPEYEIIVCGTYFDRDEPDFRYIHFSEKDELGWTTRKKNIICENAKYENLMILHDRIVLQDGWFEGMKKYGDYFDALSCRVIDADGTRRGDWFTWGAPRNRFGKIGMLEYDDWDEWVVLDGAMSILKKSVWEKSKWNEGLFWNQGEDIVFSHSLTRNGYLIRLNPFAGCRTLSWRHGEIPYYEKNSHRLGRRKGMLLRRCIWFGINLRDKMTAKL